MRVPDEPFPECIPCFVLRQAGYQAGTWLLSDRHPTLTLVDHVPSFMAEAASRR